MNTSNLVICIIKALLQSDSYLYLFSPSLFMKMYSDTREFIQCIRLDHRYWLEIPEPVPSYLNMGVPNWGVQIFATNKLTMIHQVCVYCSLSMDRNMREMIMMREDRGHILLAYVSTCVVGKKLEYCQLELQCWRSHYTGWYRSSRCCCRETPSTAGQNQDCFYSHFIQNLFSRNSVMQYTPLTLNTIQFAQHTLARLL